MPYIRGSAAVSEGISKTTLLSHRALPTQMLKTLPDLIAICQCDEKGYVAKYPSVYPDHKYCPASIATQLTDKAQLRP
jgi:hypothetical protein